MPGATPKRKSPAPGRSVARTLNMAATPRASGGSSKRRSAPAKKVTPAKKTAAPAKKAAPQAGKKKATKVSAQRAAQLLKYHLRMRAQKDRPLLDLPASTLGDDDNEAVYEAYETSKPHRCRDYARGEYKSLAPVVKGAMEGPWAFLPRQLKKATTPSLVRSFKKTPWAWEPCHVIDEVPAPLVGNADATANVLVTPRVTANSSGFAMGGRIKSLIVGPAHVRIVERL